MKLWVLLLPLLLQGAELSSLIEHALASHESLKALEQKLSTYDEQYKLSRNFANPELLLTLSDIQLKKPSDRSLEPMQYAAINFKQKIPYFGKRDADSKIVQSKEDLTQNSLEQMQTKLVESIKITAYSVYQSEEKLKILNEYIKLTKQNISLYTAYTQNDASAHMGLMSAQLLLTQQKIQKANLETMLQNLYERLSYLSNAEVDSVTFESQVTKPCKVSYYLEQFQEDKTYKNKELKVTLAQNDVESKKLAKYSDPVFQLGYFHREKFEDYLNVGVGFSLPFYGSEDLKEEVSRKELLASKSELQDYKNLAFSHIKQLYREFLNAYNVYHIIQDEALVELSHMQELSENSFKSSADLFVYTQILEKKLALEEKKIDATASYFKAKASLDAQIGAMQ